MVDRARSQISEYDEIVFYICPHAGPAAEVAGPPGIRTTRYHGWLYTTLALPVAPVDLGSLPPGDAPPTELAGLPLAGHEEMVIHWRSYAEYLSAFYGGEEGCQRLQEFLGDSLSEGLFRLVQRPLERPRVRAWWVNEAPELEDVPWESIGLGLNRRSRISIVRGRPPASVPPLPLSPDKPLTIALIDPGGLAPDPLRRALDDLGAGAVVVRAVAKDPREALSEAARAGVEVVHLCADASVPLGVEGLLDFPGGAALMPAEAEHLLRGSRVSLLALSAPAAPRVDRTGLPSVFHGFARFGRAVGDGPTVVAPLGPVAPPELEGFWRTFYGRFAEVLDAEDALVTATPHPIRVPMVMFLRQRFGRQLTRAADDWEDIVFDPGEPEGPPTPAQASADLATSGDLLDAMAELQRRYAALGLPLPGQDLVEKERERQRTLAAHVDDALSRSKER